MIHFLFLSMIFTLGIITGGCMVNKSAQQDYRKLKMDANEKLRMSDLRQTGRMALYAR